MFIPGYFCSNLLFFLYTLNPFILTKTYYWMLVKVEFTIINSWNHHKTKWRIFRYSKYHWEQFKVYILNKLFTNFALLKLRIYYLRIINFLPRFFPKRSSIIILRTSSLHAQYIRLSIIFYFYLWFYLYVFPLSLLLLTFFL